MNPNPYSLLPCDGSGLSQKQSRSIYLSRLTVGVCCGVVISTVALEVLRSPFSSSLGAGFVATVACMIILLQRKSDRSSNAEILIAVAACLLTVTVWIVATNHSARRQGLEEAAKRLRTMHGSEQRGKSEE